MIRTACYRSRAQGWAHPTADELREFLAAHGLTELAAARLVGIGGSDSNAARTMRRYKSGDRPIPYHVWRLLVLEAKHRSKRGRCD